MDQSLERFIKGMPKIELHLHIEGTLEPEMMFALAQDNGIQLPFANVEEVKEAYKSYDGLKEFIPLYLGGMNVLQTEQDFYDLTMAYLKKVKSQNVTHTEIFFDPQGHTSRGVAFETVINGIHRALKDGERDLGISSKLIMSFLRDLSEADAFDTLKQAMPHMDKIDGFGLDNPELGHPPSKFERVFAECRKTGKPVVAHAGEEGPPEYVREARDLLKVSRVDHGDRSLEDPALVKDLVAEGMGLTVCPVCKVKLKQSSIINAEGKPDMKLHQLKTMLDLGLKATVNSDDPGYFSAYITENFLAVAEALNLTRDDIVQLSRNAIDISFLSPEEKKQKHGELDTYIKRADIIEARINSSAGTLLQAM